MANLKGNQVLIEIEEKLMETKPSRRTAWCIYRVPNDIRELNKEVYTPQAVSIGPLHYKDERLQNMEAHKWEYFKEFLKRTKINYHTLVSFIEMSEIRVRHCYAEDIVPSKDEFVKIISLDACFIIELFLRHHQNQWSRDDPLLLGTRLSVSIVWDLLLLENQLPFFILDELFKLAFLSSEYSDMPSFIELTFEYFKHFNRQELNHDDVTIHHFTDLLRYFHLQHPFSSQPERTEDHEVLKFGASKLHEAALKFKVKVESNCLLGLQFSGGVLEIPKIVVEDKTDILFHNMVAFEQCHYANESYITDYVAVLGYLINTNKDVDILVENGIIINDLEDSHAVVKLINGLVKNVVWVNFNSDYVRLFKKLNKFYEISYWKLKTALRRNCCKTLWRAVFSTLASLTIFFTLVQTICSVIQVIQNA